MRALVIVAFSLAFTPAPALAQSDAEIRQRIISESIAAQPGYPCPYSRDRTGRPVGPRSSYSRPGGYAPKCYPSDVSDAEVAAYRQRLRGQ